MNTRNIGIVAALNAAALLVGVGLLTAPTDAGTPPGLPPPTGSTVPAESLGWCTVTAVDEALDADGEVVGALVVQSCIEAINTTGEPTYKPHTLFVEPDLFDRIAESMAELVEDPDDGDEFVTQ